jgi:hypothetical protein
VRIPAINRITWNIWNSDGVRQLISNGYFPFHKVVRSIWSEFWSSTCLIKSWSMQIKDMGKANACTRVIAFDSYITTPYANPKTSLASLVPGDYFF